MQNMKGNHLISRSCSVAFYFTLTVLLLGSSVLPASGATRAQYNAMPPFLSTSVPPNVMFMLDNSGSMKHSLYDGGSWKCSSFGSDFVSNKDYYGVFDEDTNYTYDTSITIDYNGYNGLPYDIDTNGDTITDSNDVNAAPGAFVEDSTCSPGVGVNCWDGNFLNWMVTRRIDAARKVMIGGKVESREGFDYKGGDGGDLEWKIVANNERSDNTICKSGAAAQSYTPFPNGVNFKVRSPADAGATLTTYDPYEKLEVLNAPQFIVDNSVTPEPIGEYGMTGQFDENAGADDWKTITLAGVYIDPVVVATPVSYDGADPSVIRIKSVTSTSFDIRIEEYESDDGSHTTEDVSYLVIEKGNHTLGGGQKVVAEEVAVDHNWLLVDTSAALFPAGDTPVIIASVVSDNDHNTVTTRLKLVDDNSFEVRLQEELNANTHGSETVAYIGLEKGDYIDGAGNSFEVGSQSVNSSFETISFTEVTDPRFLASIQSFNESDTAALRYKVLTTSDVALFVEEERSIDADMTHIDEEVGYVVVSNNELLQFNLALLVEDEPKGLLHNVVDQVRLGISFYNYKKDTDIYNSEWFHGGTMKLDIPKNPFIKGPDATTGYRVNPIDTYVDSGIDGIVDAIEHYPLVWGTTPLAENYYEVVRYFQQEDPYFTDTINSGGINYRDTYEVSNTWDPYYFNDPNGDGNTSDAGKVDCVESYVLLFTDGQPYRDDYLPCYDSGDDEFNDDGASTAACTDFDGDNSGNERFNTDDGANSGKDNLDDIVYWANAVVDNTLDDDGDGVWDKTADRDLRSDLAQEQNLITYTVAFGSATMPDILQDSADQGEGVAYPAEDGNQLKEQLTEAFAAILNRVSGTAASVISNTRSGEGAIYQSIFFPQKKDTLDNEVSWVGQIHSLLVDAYGNMREDTNQNQQVDLIDDLIVVYNSDGTAYRYRDADGDQLLEDLTPEDCRQDHSCNTCSTDDTVDCMINGAYDVSGLTDITDDKINLDDLKYLWNTSDWLNEISDTEVEDQRGYASILSDRYIFTWVDADDDGVVDTATSEVMPFVSASTPTAADLIDPAKIYPYLHLYPSFDNIPTGITNDISDLSTADFAEFLAEQSRRQVNYIRGSDCVDASSSLTCNTMSLTVDSGATTVVGSSMRSRQFDYDGDNTVETWRLGDIVYSTPTLVGRPAEAYHLLYRDKSYASFAARYQMRRNVVYAGANDGMVHAFNGGFFDAADKKFYNSIEEPYGDADDDGTFTAGEYYDWDGSSGRSSTTAYELGAEMWAYVPYNLLPHLYWLTDPTYDAGSHIYYVDQKPRIFDARIFPTDTDHPNGWGTVMVIGMRFGGGTIVTDMDKQSTTCEDRSVCSLETTCLSGDGCSLGDTCGDGTSCLTGDFCSNDSSQACADDGDCGGATDTCDPLDTCTDGSTCGVQTCGDSSVCEVRACGDGSTCEDRGHPDVNDRIMRSAYIVFDITNPEVEPQLLAEVVMPKMGFATSFPTVVVLTDGDGDQNYKSNNKTVEAGENKWFLAFGSGPADANGDPGTLTSSTGAYNNEILESAQSLQAGNFYMLDLKKLATDNELWTITDDTTGSGGSVQGVLEEGLASYETFESNSFVTAPITVDYNLDYNADALYFGTISGSPPTSWKGKLRRIVIADENSPLLWNGDNVMMDVEQPISAAPAVGIDDDGRNWVYFGTGRFFSTDDKGDTSLQTYYGIKEPIYDSGDALYDATDPLKKSWAQVSAPENTRPNGPNAAGASPLVGSLINTTNYQVFTDKSVWLYDSSHLGKLEDWDYLLSQQNDYSGWYLDFDGDHTDDTTITQLGERNLGQAALLGGLLSYTTFTPDADICKTGGTSDLWALFYKTGTAHYSAVLDVHDRYINNTGTRDRAKRSLGDLENNESSLIEGMSTSPSVHTGRQGGSAVFVQSSTGEIIRIEEENPMRTKSGMQAWKLR